MSSGTCAGNVPLAAFMHMLIYCISCSKPYLLLASVSDDILCFGVEMLAFLWTLKGFFYYTLVKYLSLGR